MRQVIAVISFDSFSSWDKNNAASERDVYSDVDLD